MILTKQLFSLRITDAERATARSARFGTSTVCLLLTGSKQIADTGENKSKKKDGITDATARSARFGTSFSTPDILSKAKKLSARPERFGIKKVKLDTHHQWIWKL